MGLDMKHCSQGLDGTFRGGRRGCDRSINRPPRLRRKHGGKEIFVGGLSETWGENAPEVLRTCKVLWERITPCFKSKTDLLLDRARI